MIRRTLNSMKYRMNLFRGLRLRVLIKLWGGTCGRRLAIEPRVRLMRPPARGWHIGSDVYLGHGVILDIGTDAHFALGDRSKVFHYTLLGAFDRLDIAHDVQIAESVSVRDHNHDVNADDMHKSMTCAPVTIGSGAWIARGAAILAGVTIGSGAVVGANAVVTHDVAARSVVAGVPARVLRHRDWPGGEERH